MSSQSEKVPSSFPARAQAKWVFIRSRLPVIQANFELPTLLAIGMCLQGLIFVLLPSYLSVAPAALLLIYKLSYTRPKGVEANWNLKHARLGKWSATVPNHNGTMPEKAGSNGVVCFVVGNHPLGLFAPGLKETATWFMDMWKDAAENRERWGYLSHTAPLVSQGPNRGNFLVVLSYWKSLDHLRDFAAHSVHAEGRKWWERTRQQWPHIGIFHETYVVPPGHWETIYENMWPFGMGQIRRVEGNGEGWKLSLGEVGGVLGRADGNEWRSMDVRMGRGD
ncbi:uncharacterized protein KY384_006374 [Bacidia gigantensis]|uniref:uncharacterized protein n=1 Tax=Bacidia gigantensis TaxID=2732470 RepID=UPI001D04AD01|nr:uncharacterized protein KY384_006374 [Bacidia gigantensis]KAG8528687.1 hypothetical protein KY384_006374 [Bacidia gigantensis]